MRDCVETVPLGWVPPCNRQIYDAEAVVCAQEIAAGRFPELPNDFQLVFDPFTLNDPRKYVSGHIPAEQYTWHVAQRQIAMSRPGTGLHNHDINHIPGFQRMFRSGTYANLIQTAAFNALGSPTLCEIFAGAHDNFADQTLFLYKDDGFNHVANLAHTREHLYALIDLAYMGTDYDVGGVTARRQATFDELSAFFELDKYQWWYDTTYERVQVL